MMPRAGGGNSGWGAAQADIVHLLNRELSTEFDLEQPWTAFTLAAAGSAEAPDEPQAEVGPAEAPGEGPDQAATLLQGGDLPSDTDDSSYRCWACPAPDTEHAIRIHRLECCRDHRCSCACGTPTRSLRAPECRVQPYRVSDLGMLRKRSAHVMLVQRIRWASLGPTMMCMLAAMRD